MTILLVMSNANCVAPPASVTCPCCDGSGRAQYGCDDSGNPCGPTFACSECDGDGEVVDYDRHPWGAGDTEPPPAVHSTVPCGPPVGMEVA